MRSIAAWTEGSEADFVILWLECRFQLVKVEGRFVERSSKVEFVQQLVLGTCACCVVNGEFLMI